MKRFIVTILTVFYMAGAMGATVHLHYCMGDFVNASLIHHDEHKCDKCGMTKKSDNNGCCKDEHKTIKTAEHHKSNATIDIVKHFVPHLPVALKYPTHTTSFIPSGNVVVASAHAPPDIGLSCPIYIRIRNLRI